MAYVDWIKIEHTTPDKQEVLRISEILSMNPYEVLGRLVKVWIWADQNLKDGHSFVTSLSQISHVAGVTNFGEAMKESGWIVVKDGKLVFPNFLKHNGKSAKTRADSQKRQRQSRDGHGSVTDLSHKTPNEVVTPSTSTLDSSLEEGVGETFKSDIVFQDLPKQLDFDNFKRTWVEWESYTKKKTGNAFQPYQRGPAWRAILEDFSTPNDAIKAITQAMARGYKQYYKPDKPKHTASEEPVGGRREDPAYVAEYMAKREQAARYLAERQAAKAKEAANANAS